MLSLILFMLFDAEWMLRGEDIFSKGCELLRVCRMPTPVSLFTDDTMWRVLGALESCNPRFFNLLKACFDKNVFLPVESDVSLSYAVEAAFCRDCEYA